MTVIQKRAEYLVGLMPTLSKGIARRIPAFKCKMQDALTMGQMHILGFLHHRGPETMGAMAKCSGVALSTMTESINPLVKMGLVMRTPDARDRRVVKIQLSPRGQSVFKKQIGQKRELFVKLLETLSEAKQQRLVRAFRAIETILLS